MAELPPPPPPVEVEVVIVHPPRLAPLGGEEAFSAFRIEPEMLKANPRLDEALKQAPGVSLFRRTESAGANPTIQGLSLRSIAPSGAGRALVTLDGAPQNDPFGGWVIWSALPPEGLESATIVRGAGAGPYGAGALTGVVALEERAADGGLGALELSAGERDSYRVAASGGAPGLVATGSFEITEGYTAVRGPARGAADRPLEFQAQSLAVRAQHTFGEVQAAARVGAYSERRHSGVQNTRAIASGGSASVTLAKPAAQGVGGWRLQAWARDSDLKNSFAAIAEDRSVATPANDQYETPAQGYGLNGALQGVAGGLGWEFGADVRMTEGEARERFRNLGAGFTRHRQAGGKTAVGGVYLEAALQDGPWVATGGVRVDRWKSWDAVRRETDLATGAVVLDQRAPDASGTTPTARLGLRYSLAPETWVRAAAYAGFRAPTLNELHRPFRVGNDITEANPGLEPETLQGVEVGFGGEGQVNWQATLFLNRLQDPITNVTIGFGPGNFPVAGFVPAGGVLRQRQNAGEIEAWGFEGEVDGGLGQAAFWRAAVSYTDAEVDGGAVAPQLTGLRPAQTPKWTATAGLQWLATSRLSLSGDLRYESARWEDDLNTRKLAGGVLLDARAAWRLTETSEVYLAAENLGDAELEVGETGDGVESYVAPRTIRVGFSLRR